MQRACRIGVLLLGMSCASSGGGSAPSALPAQPEVQRATDAPARPTPAGPKDAITTTALPDTAAGRALQTWLDVFNGGDESRMQAFATQYELSPGTLEMPSLRKLTGGFDVLGVEKSSPLEIVFILREKVSPTRALGWLKLEDADHPNFHSFALRAIPPDGTGGELNVSVDATTRDRVIAAVAARLTEFYVYPDVAQAMDHVLRDHQMKGEYAPFDTAPALAAVLTEQLQALSHDRHLHVDFVPMGVPDGDPEATAADKAKIRERLERANCGFEKSERMDGNIGYVKFDMFGPAEICGPKATAALGSLNGVAALIFDLRDNNGGEPDMVAFVESYLFEKRTRLDDIYDRKQDRTAQYWTQPDVPGAKFSRHPVYVLTSRRTFSAAEAFCYDLRNLHRATLIGETTGGGAHPTTTKRLDAHFVIRVPYARAINPITKTNWEGKGVEPDVSVPADQALEVAKKLAEQKQPSVRER
jgi:hypothetical protein